MWSASAKPSAYLVGEMWRDADGWLDVFDGLMNYPLRGLLLDFCVRDHMDAEDLAIESEALLRRTPIPRSCSICSAAMTRPD